MATENDILDPDDIEISDSNIDKLAGAISRGIAATAPKKVTLGQYDRRSPNQPDKRLTHTLKHVCYQNGYRIPAKRLTNAEIDGLNAITRPGRYINRMVEVALWDDGGVVHLDLRYTNLTADSRFENKNHFRSFEELVTKIVVEQNAILAKAARTQSAVSKLLEQNAAEDVDLTPDPRIESVAQTPKQEADVKKKVQRQSFASAATRKARAEAGV